MYTPSTRRGFLRTLGTAALAAPLSGRLAELAAGLDRGLAAATLEPGPEAVRALRAEYLLDPGILYLNHASIGTVPRVVHEAHRGYAELCESNPWLYMWGGAWEAAREEVRAAVAGLLGSAPGDVALTHNTTEGFNLLAAGLPLGPGDEVLFSTLNHDGASVCWEHRGADRGYRVRRFDFPAERAAELSPDDVVDLYDRQITAATRVVVFPHVDNAVGIRHPLDRLVARARERGVRWVAVDGAQTVGMIPLDLPGSGVDAYAGSPHKWVQAPKGLGVLYLTPEIREVLRPMWVTWGQRRWGGSVRIFEDYGTRNLPELLALGAAAAFQRGLGDAAKDARYRAVHGLMRERVEAAPGLQWRSPPAFDDGASLVAVEVDGTTADRLAGRLLESDGLVVRAFRTATLNTLRLSPNVATLDEELHRAFDLLEEASP